MILLLAMSLVLSAASAQSSSPKQQTAKMPSLLNKDLDHAKKALPKMVNIQVMSIQSEELSDTVVRTIPKAGHSLEEDQTVWLFIAEKKETAQKIASKKQVKREVKNPPKRPWILFVFLQLLAFGLIFGVYRLWQGESGSS